jgi:hypothetical protein
MTEGDPLALAVDATTLRPFVKDTQRTPPQTPDQRTLRMMTAVETVQRHPTTAVSQQSVNEVIHQTLVLLNF